MSERKEIKSEEIERKEIKLKLENAFKAYDTNYDQFLDSNEISQCLLAMLEILGADRKNHNIDKIKDDFMEQLDLNKDKKLSPEEFIGKHYFQF